MHIFLIEIRRCHVGYLGCYGNDWLSTPALDAIAATGLVFDSHYADRVGEGSDRPAWNTVNCNGRPTPLESLLADRDCQVHWLGTWAGSAHRPLEAALFRQLAVQKERCLVAIGLNDLLPPWDLADTAETSDPEAYAGDIDAEPKIPNDLDAAVLKVREAYAHRVEALDQWFGKFLDQFHDKRLLDRAAIIVTADQGISLGEHAPAGTLPAYPYEEIRHLPLIIGLPGAECAGTRISTVTQTSDMPHAILGLLDGAHTAKTEFDLLSLGQAKESARDYARTVQVSEAGSQTVAIRTPEWAFLSELGSDSPVSELYRKPDDRWEINNVVQHYPDLVPKMETLARVGPAR
jgi:arylsulfatase A-like enzyme